MHNSHLINAQVWLLSTLKTMHALIPTQRLQESLVLTDADVEAWLDLAVAFDQAFDACIELDASDGTLYRVAVKIFLHNPRSLQSQVLLEKRLAKLQNGEDFTKGLSTLGISKQWLIIVQEPFPDLATVIDRLLEEIDLPETSKAISFV